MDKIERVLDAVEGGLTATVGKNWEITNVDCPDDGLHFNVVAWGFDKDLPKPEQTNRLDFTDDERAEITAYSMECLSEFVNDDHSDAWFGLQCQSGRTFDINIFGTDEWDLDGKATCWAYHVGEDGQTKTHISEHLWMMPIDAGAVTLRGKQLQALKSLIDYNWNDEAKSYAESGLPLDKHIFGQLNELATHMGRVNRG